MLSDVPLRVSFPRKMDRNNLMYNDNSIRNAFVFEIAFGISANTALLLFHVAMFFEGLGPKPINMIIGVLALSHIVMLLANVAMATDVFGSQVFWDDVTCKSVISLSRLMRSISICATCHLSVLQVLILSPRSSCLAKVKPNSFWHNLCCFLSLWAFYVPIHGFLNSTVSSYNMTSHVPILVTKSCSLQVFSDIARHVLSILTVFRDASLVGIMVLSSVYMVTVLCRHKRLHQYLHSASISRKASPEQRAIRSILWLLSFFLVMYCLDSIASSSRVMGNKDPVHRCAQMFVSSGYATMSPLVFIVTEQRFIHFLKTTWGQQ